VFKKVLSHIHVLIDIYSKLSVEYSFVLIKLSKFKANCFHFLIAGSTSVLYPLIGTGIAQWYNTGLWTG
jgi:hypothetical protein